MSCWTEWDPLEEVIVGDSFLIDDLDWQLPPSTKDKFAKILEETKEDLDGLARKLDYLGIKVYRPNPTVVSDNISVTKDFTISHAMAPMVPRDQYFVYGDTVYQTYTSMPDRYFDSYCYYDIFKQLFDQGYNWISQPPPILETLDLSTFGWQMSGEKVYSDYYKNKLLWHTACMFKYGDSIMTNYSPGTQLGFEWMSRNMPNTKIYRQERFGHIDHGFFSIDDDTIICDNKEWVPASLANKKIIEISPLLNERRNYDDWINTKVEAEEKLSDEWLDQYLEEWKGYYQSVCFDFNPLVIDSKNILFANDQPKLFKLLASMGIECHVAQLRHSAFWDGGIHCLTLDIKRKGDRRNIIN